jgi:hypothetical protein
MLHACVKHSMWRGILKIFETKMAWMNESTVYAAALQPSELGAEQLA